MWVRFSCKTCGKSVAIDEDGCCVTCGLLAEAIENEPVATFHVKGEPEESVSVEDLAPGTYDLYRRPE